MTDSTLTSLERDYVRKAVRIMTLAGSEDDEQMNMLLDELLMPDGVTVNHHATHGLMLLCGMLLEVRENETHETRAQTLQNVGVALEILEAADD